MSGQEIKNVNTHTHLHTYTRTKKTQVVAECRLELGDEQIKVCEHAA